MFDSRVAQFAKILVEYSTRVKRGDVVLINAVSAETYPVVKELHKLCLQKRAKYVQYDLEFPDATRDFYNFASQEQAAFFPQHKLDFMKTVDVFIGIRAPENAMAYANANQDIMRLNQKTTLPILDERVNHTRWVVTRWPTQAAAQDAKMSLEEFYDFFFGCTIYDYVGLQQKQAKLVRLMNRANQVRIKASDTDLTFSMKGMKAISCHGDKNIPDGEVYSVPVRDSVEGYLKYNTPSIYMGREFTDIRFEFEKGKIVKAEAGALTGALNKVLDTDEGARYIGEFSLGTNTGIRQPMRNALFDEKIFGSIHFTPGQAYEDCDNGNRSAIHWDLVKILVGDGEIIFDGKTIQRDGVFVHPELVELNPQGTKRPKQFAAPKR
jgi:aminopeptidase